MPATATEDPMGTGPYFGVLRVSADMGETWQYGGRIAQGPVAHLTEPAVHLTPAGRLIILFRCHVRRDMARQDRELFLAFAESDDVGRTWAQWRATSVHGSPGHLLGLRDERILLTVGTRWPGQRGCVARVLDPEATDLETAPEVAVRTDSSDRDCGYPWAVQLRNGRVLVVYYYVHPDGVRGIEGSILEETPSS